MKTHPQDGWPPDAAPGEWLGWDATGLLSVLRWSVHRDHNAGKGLWVGVRFDPRNPVPRQGDDYFGDGRQWPLAFMRGPDTESFVVKHRPAIGARGE